LGEPRTGKTDRADVRMGLVCKFKIINYLNQDGEDYIEEDWKGTGQLEISFTLELSLFTFMRLH
jgi:hypothetical protein